MITCSKCKQQFPLNWRMISRDSKVNCTNCGNECLVTLFDLKNHSDETNDGFSSIEPIEHYKEIRQNEEKETKSLNNHFLIAIVILNLIAGVFLLGIYQIEFLEEKLPRVAVLYNRISIAAKKNIIVKSFEVKKVGKVININLILKNSSDKPDLVSDIEILIRDSFNNVVGATNVRPHKIIQSGKELNLKLNVTGINEDGRKISIFINGKVSLESKITYNSRNSRD
jgi:hypothetical protein